METELLAIVKNKLGFEQFCLDYFETVEIDGNYYHKTSIEKLNLSIAWDFYEDYVASKFDIIEYIMKTSI